jgi:hypothetical protein
MIEPLFELLKEQKYSTGIENLKTSLLKADNFLEQFPIVPYFDCSLRNIIVPQSSLGKKDCFSKLVYIDFDKSHRNTIIGEQLSHLLLDESLKIYKETTLLTYSQIANRDLFLIKKVVSVCLFIRSLSWLRYSLQWILRDLNNDCDATIAVNTAKWALISALNTLEDFRLSIGINNKSKNLIVSLLHRVYSKNLG